MRRRSRSRSVSESEGIEVAEEAKAFYGTGRRKEAVAKVWIRPGTGEFKVNGKEALALFTRVPHQMLIHGPLKATGMENKLDVSVSTIGGGMTGQAGAIRMGLARALVCMDETMRKALRDGGHMTRDPRMKERKKYGQKRARKRFQFSKR